MKTDVLIEGGRPSVKAMVAAVEDSVRDAGTYFERLDEAERVRFCQWPGQQRDGRKGEGGFPWKGASDTRVRAADEIVNEQVMVMTLAFFRMQVQAVGVESNDQVTSRRVTDLMKWVLYGKMLDHLWREVNLAAQWRQSSGLAVMSIEWDQQTRVEEVPMDFEGLRDRLVELGAVDEGSLLYDIQSVMMDPLREEDALLLLRGLSPEMVNGSTARRLLRQLRVEGVMRLPVASYITNQPRWVALRPYVDVFFRTEADDLQREPWVARVEYVTEEVLRDRIVTLGYDEGFVEEAVKQKGVRFQSLDYTTRYIDGRRSDGRMEDEHREEIELVHMYAKSAEEDGRPALYYTVLNAGVGRGSDATKDLCGLHEKHGYDHGRIPMVLLVREHVSRRVADSRGAAELAGTWQQEKKVHRDARTDHAQIATIPPLIVPPGRGAADIEFGPGVKWPGRRGLNPEWAQVPQLTPGALELERAAERDMDRYFGRGSENVLPAMVQLHQGHLVMGWLIELRLCVGQTFQLMQQFMDDEVVQRVTGRVTEGFRVGREEIRGQYDFFLDFDVRSLDPEFVQAKLKAVQELVLPADRFGVIDMAKYVEKALGAIDQAWADELVMDRQSASEREMKEEQEALALMVSGQEAPMKLGNLNYGLRLQVLTQAVEKNPELQAMILQRPLLQRMIQERVKYLQQQITQQENAVTGRTGGRPVLGPAVGIGAAAGA